MNQQTAQAVDQLTDRRTMSGELSVEEYKAIWLNAYPRGLNSGPRYYKQRLRELETFDTSNGKPNERAGKIAALKELIG